MPIFQHWWRVGFPVEDKRRNFESWNSRSAVFHYLNIGCNIIHLSFCTLIVVHWLSSKPFRSIYNELNIYRSLTIMALYYTKLCLMNNYSINMRFSAILFVQIITLFICSSIFVRFSLLFILLALSQTNFTK